MYCKDSYIHFQFYFDQNWSILADIEINSHGQTLYSRVHIIKRFFGPNTRGYTRGLPQEYSGWRILLFMNRDRPLCTLQISAEF
jgi:hypothetical protein